MSKTTVFTKDPRLFRSEDRHVDRNPHDSSASFLGLRVYPESKVAQHESLLYPEVALNPDTLAPNYELLAFRTSSE